MAWPVRESAGLVRNNPRLRRIVHSTSERPGRVLNDRPRAEDRFEPVRCRLSLPGRLLLIALAAGLAVAEKVREILDLRKRSGAGEES